MCRLNSACAGFGIVGLVHMAYYISGADLNPMVTLIGYLRGKYSVKMALIVVVVQILAGVCAGGIGRAINGGAQHFALLSYETVRFN